MKPLNNYLIKSFERANLEQIADTYREKGYSIKTDARIGPYRVDLVAIKGDETIYIELKTHTERPEAKHRIKEMADYLNIAQTTYSDYDYTQCQIYSCYFPYSRIQDYCV